MPFLWVPPSFLILPGVIVNSLKGKIIKIVNKTQFFTLKLLADVHI
ncbi:Uncharacterised protein [Legionella feeleii]|uniref:Uncharacterized protein n=1 Tax=Legionella feeleii TaxID=453 RepID=A0A2X1QLG7_9GAMM|nr:Uncharacterised protein [Legionella feeleii]